MVIARPRSVGDTRRALAALVDHPDRRAQLGRAARARVEAELTYDVLARRLAEAIASV
jgi:glycosyltransferase involved in cell wall biosynthesis